MAEPDGDLVRDAASLQRFMRSICYREEDIDRTHRPATKTFFGYLADLEKQTELYLEQFVKTPPNPVPLLASLDRESLLTFRVFWNKLHEFAKPVRDADTLHVPVVLVDLLENSLSRLKGLRGSRVLIYHTSRLNYLQYPRGHLRNGGARYVNMIRKLIRRRVPHFPDKLALVGIPYSQDSVLFSNLLLCHELGHFVFEEFLLPKVLAPHYQNSLSGLLGRHPKALEVSWCTSRLAAWSEEIFCDRFAIALMGPAASFSFIELFDLVGSASAQDVEFSDSHPADMCRLHDQFDQLDLGGWWALLDAKQTQYSKLIRRAHKVREAKYIFKKQGNPPHLCNASLLAFQRMRPVVAQLVKGIFGTKEVRYRSAPDLECVGIIHEYLKRGVVPATLVKNGKEYRPDPILLVNAAYLFYLRNVPDLIGMIRGGKPSDITQRAHWGERVEQWTLKAMEDLRLPNTRPLWGS